MTILRPLILAMAMALGTVLVPWWIVPVLGFGYGLVAKGSARPALTAGVAGALAWGGYLAILSFGGAPVGRLGAQLGASMGLPAFVPLVATLAFPALLAATASYLGSQLGPQPDTSRRRR